MQKIIGLFSSALCAITLQGQVLQWAATMGGTTDDQTQELATDPAGNVYATGDFTGAGDFEPGPGVTTLTSNGGTDIFVEKFDVDGNMVYALRFGGTQVEAGVGIAADAGGNAYVTGYFQSPMDMDPGPNVFTLTSQGWLDAFLMKLDPAGALVWAFSIGALGFDEGHSIEIDADGNLMLAGYYEGTSDADPGPDTTLLSPSTNRQPFVCKYDPDGALLWAKGFGGSVQTMARRARMDHAGNILITGQFVGTNDFDPGPDTVALTSVGMSDVFVVKLDPNGDFLWARSFGGSSGDIGFGVGVDASDNVYTTGHFQGAADFDPGSGVQTLTSAGVEDIFVSKLDSMGDLVWAFGLGTAGLDQGFAVEVDDLDHLRLAGTFFGQMDADPGPGVSNLTGGFTGGTAYLIELDTSAAFIAAGRIGSIGDDGALCLHADGSNLFAGGYFEVNVDLDPGPGSLVTSSHGDKDAFVLKFGDTSTAIAQHPSAPFMLFPNPATDRVTVQGLSGSAASGYVVRDLLGRICDQGSITPFLPSIDLAALPSGTYTVQIGTAPTQVLVKQ